MAKSKLELIIHQLTNKECQIIKESMMSPLLEGKKQHLLLLNAFLKEKGKRTEINRDKIREKVFKNEISDAQLRLYMSELYKIISSTLVMLLSKEDPYYQDKVLISRFKQLEEHKLFDAQFSSAFKRLENYPYRNSEFLDLKYELGFMEYTQLSSKSRTRELNIQNLLDDVDLIFISKKLRQACFAISHQAVYEKEYDYGLLPEVIQYVEQNDLLKHPSVRLYFSIFHMLNGSKEVTHFDKFKADIDELKNFFPDSELQSIYRFVINQCIRRLNRGQLEYGTIALDLYEESIINKYLLVDGYLSRFTFRNIVAIAVKIGEYDRAEKFNNEYYLALKKDERQSILKFNQALIAYHRKDFDTALISLRDVDFKDHLFNLAAKVIQIKIYYESNELDLLDSHLDAMKMYILRKKLIGYYKTNYKNMIKMTRKLLKIKPRDSVAIENLRSEISQTEVLTEKKWLLNQLLLQQC